MNRTDRILIAVSLASLAVAAFMVVSLARTLLAYSRAQRVLMYGGE